VLQEAEGLVHDVEALTFQDETASTASAMQDVMQRAGHASSSEAYQSLRHHLQVGQTSQRCRPGVQRAGMPWLPLSTQP